MVGGWVHGRSEFAEMEIQKGTVVVGRTGSDTDESRRRAG
jgi:hypothetical protein